jgi:hypothetical protein
VKLLPLSMYCFSTPRSSLSRIACPTPERDDLRKPVQRCCNLLRFCVETNLPLVLAVQGLGIVMLVVASLLFESLADPRTTHIMSILGCLEQVVVCIVVCVGILETGSYRHYWRSVSARAMNCVRFGAAEIWAVGVLNGAFAAHSFCHQICACRKLSRGCGHLV